VRALARRTAAGWGSVRVVCPACHAATERVYRGIEDGGWGPCWRCQTPMVRWVAQKLVVMSTRRMGR
jgi:hypothetical protein